MDGFEEHAMTTWWMGGKRWEWLMLFVLMLLVLVLLADSDDARPAGALSLRGEENGSIICQTFVAS